VYIDDGEEVEDGEGEDEEVDEMEAVGGGGVESQEVEGPEPEERKVGGVEGVGSSARAEDVTEVEELGGAMWEAGASRAMIDMEQGTEDQHVKDLLACFDTREARGESSGFGGTFSKVRICIRSWVDKRRLIVEAVDFIDEGENSEETMMGAVRKAMRV